ncbi:putative molybdenum carrier protein [Salisaeta longa]|uniref:putative molybdenum carrier protein n=1 Tax=Salisaeta longa TaxID=503170 RepID=UPI0003B5A836|nr:putative molybdenum carrier protein [Salisaeta longa]
MIETIVSGGQTGVDRAALDAAQREQVAIGGWCPRGRRAADGVIPERYPLKETPEADYAQRTTWNVRDSDGTLILSPEPLTGGTAFTRQEAQRLGRPLMQVEPSLAHVTRILSWVQQHRIRRLNVAGPRARTEPGIYKRALRVMEGVLRADRAKTIVS